jgi:hypothetical protein
MANWVGMEGKQTSILGENLLQILCSNVRYLQKAVQVQAEHWQEPKTDIPCMRGSNVATTDLD